MAAGLRPMAGNAWGFHADSLVDATSVLSPSRGALTMTGGGSAGSLGMSCVLYCTISCCVQFGGMQVN